MQSGNGIDLPAVYQLLQEAVRRVGGIESALDSHTQKLNQLTAVADEHTRKLDQLMTVVNDHTRRIDDIAAGLSELRLAVDHYHDAVIGHGIELTALSERVKRIESHLKLHDPTAS
jgi:uncharacterized coiled-coil DUF342 family protein